LSNSTDAQTIIAKGVDHKSPFACKNFKLIFLPDDNGAAISNTKFDTDESRKHFWATLFATSLVAAPIKKGITLQCTSKRLLILFLAFRPPAQRKARQNLLPCLNVFQWMSTPTVQKKCQQMEVKSILTLKSVPHSMPLHTSGA
jgi:hypothetical protein